MLAWAMNLGFAAGESIVTATPHRRLMRRGSTYWYGSFIVFSFFF